MQQELLIAIGAGLGGMLGWGFADFFAKKTIDRIGDVATLVWAHVFGSLILAIVALYQLVVLGGQFTIPSDVRTWGLLLFFGTLQAIVYFLLYRGFGKGKLALLNPVFASYSGVAAVLSIVIFGEVIHVSLLLALALVFAGIVLLNIEPGALRIKRINIVRTPGLEEVLVASLLAALWTVSWDKFVGGKDWLSYALFMYIFMSLAAFAISRLQRIKLLIVKPGLWKFLILIGLGEVVAYLSISLGFSMTALTSVVAVLSGAFSLPTIILARVFLREKVTRLHTAASLIIIFGIVLLSLLSNK